MFHGMPLPLKDRFEERAQLAAISFPSVLPGGLRGISLIAGSLAPLPLAVMAAQSDFIILSIRLTIRPQNDRLALP